jgi:protein-disulfide isomerase
VLAAQAARCAGQQSKFWEYHDYLYANQRGINSGQFSTANLQAFAAQLRLDTAAFNSCLERGEDLAQIRGQLAAGRERGVNTTPYFIINGQRLAGAQSLNRFLESLDAELARSGQ